MNKEETIKSLMDFASYMGNVEDDFQQMSDLKKEYDNARKGAVSIWGNLLSGLSRFAFVYAATSFACMVVLKVQGNTVDSLTGLSELTCKIFVPVWWVAMIAMAMGALFSYWASKELHIENKKQVKRNAVRNQMQEVYSNIEEQYSGYKNPPVTITYSNPYFILDIVDVLEKSKKDNMSLEEAISKAKTI